MISCPMLHGFVRQLSVNEELRKVALDGQNPALDGRVAARPFRLPAA
jgi:hypothetical protein